MNATRHLRRVKISRRDLSAPLSLATMVKITCVPAQPSLIPTVEKHRLLYSLRHAYSRMLTKHLVQPCRPRTLRADTHEGQIQQSIIAVHNTAQQLFMFTSRTVTLSSAPRPAARNPYSSLNVGPICCESRPWHSRFAVIYRPGSTSRSSPSSEATTLQGPCY